MINAQYINPYSSLYNMKDTTRRERMIKKLDKSRKKHKQKSKSRGDKRRQREKTRMQSKADSPGVPANTCPYIDMIITIVTDLQNAYDRLREKGEYNPMVTDMATQAQDTLEFVRRSNETLRDNSAYWYGKYKELLQKQ